MANFNTLQTFVQNRLIDVQAVTTSEIVPAINKAIRKLQDLHNFAVMEAWTGFVTTTPTPLTHVLGTLPADYKELRRTEEPFYVDNTGNPVRMFVRPTLDAVLDEFALNAQTEIGDPHVLWISRTDSGGGNAENSGPGMQASLWPYPDGQSNYTGTTTVPMPDGLGNALSVPATQYPILLPYFRYLPPLVQGTDQNWFTDNAEDFIVWYASAQGFRLNWDFEKAEMLEDMALGKSYRETGKVGGDALRVINIDKRRALRGLGTLEMRPDVYGHRGRFRNPFTQVPGQ